MLLGQFGLFESEAKRLMDAQLALPAYEMVLKCRPHLQPARRPRRDLA